MGKQKRKLQGHYNLSRYHLLHPEIKLCECPLLGVQLIPKNPT